MHPEGNPAGRPTPGARLTFCIGSSAADANNSFGRNNDTKQHNTTDNITRLRGHIYRTEGKAVSVID
jgi:hypothetical protein